MLRIAILLAGTAVLTGCGSGIEEELAGTWDCAPETTVADNTFTLQLNYDASGDLDGTMIYESPLDGNTMNVRGSIDGTWNYDGETINHTMVEKFEELKLNGEVIPREQVDPALIDGFGDEGPHESPVDIVDGELLWYSDAKREAVDLRCKKAG